VPFTKNFSYGFDLNHYEILPDANDRQMDKKKIVQQSNKISFDTGILMSAGKIISSYNG